MYPPLGHSGHDERCRQAVHGLARRGHRVQVITSNHRLPPVGGLKEKGIFRELCLHEDSYQWEFLGKRYWPTYAHELTNAQCLEYRVRKFNPDIVYVWNMRGLSKSLLFRLQEKKVRLVFDLHSEWLSPAIFEDDPWFRWRNERPNAFSHIYRKVVTSFGMMAGKLRHLPIKPSTELDLSRSYLCSESLRETLLQAGIEGVAELPVVYPFADETLLKPKEQYTKRKHFMWAGRVSDAKAPDLAIKAVGHLREKGVEVKLDIFGMGEQAERKAMREEIQKMGLSDLVQMKGIRPGELREHYANYDALLFTSRFEDPFPMTVLEAMLSKLPCILANTGGIPEIAGDSGNVILFGRDDAAALANAIEHFLGLEDNGLRMAERCILSLRGSGSFDCLLGHIESLQF